MANKEIKNNDENKKSKKKLFIILGSAVGACAVAGASVGIYFAVKGNNGNDVATVTEQEFNKAVSLEGISFFQLETKTVGFEVKYEFSPTVFYGSKYTISNEGEGEIMVRKKDDGTYERVSKGPGKDWGNVESAEASDFKNPSSEAPKKHLDNAGLSYSSFSFSNKKYSWESQEGEGTISLYFVNKKCVKFETIQDETKATIKYAYDNKTPVWPK